MANEITVLASVGGKNITSADVEEFIRGMGPRGEQYRSPEGQSIILELYEAEPAFKAQLQRVKENLLAGYAMEKALSAVKVTDAEIEKFYEENKDRLGGGETVRASHILVDSEEKANALKEEIESGKITFEDAARRDSSCPSKEEGGNLGEFGRGQMVKEFDDACFSMNVGELRGPVKTQFGYHLIRLDAKNEAKTPALADVKEEIRAKLLSDKQNAAYRSKVNQLKIVYPVDMYR